LGIRRGWDCEEPDDSCWRWFIYTYDNGLFLRTFRYRSDDIGSVHWKTRAAAAAWSTGRTMVRMSQHSCHVHASSTSVGSSRLVRDARQPKRGLRRLTRQQTSRWMPDVACKLLRQMLERISQPSTLLNDCEPWAERLLLSSRSPDRAAAPGD
jgi:hypothetical protein